MRIDAKQTVPPKVNVFSETSRLRAVLLHRPGVEIERMTPANAAEALYSDILNKSIVDEEFHYFSGVLERWADVYYVEDILAGLLGSSEMREIILAENLRHCDYRTRIRLAEMLGELDADQLAKVLIEGFQDPKWDGISERRYLLKPLYNLFFTRDASATIYNRVLINSMSEPVRERETLLYDTIFRRYFHTETLNALDVDPFARTEGGDVQIASPDLLCIGQGQRTNAKGIDYLGMTFARERDHFNIIVQELPLAPESFIHLDMVFTFLGKHRCMAFEPMLRRRGLFADKETSIVNIDHGKVTFREAENIVDALRMLGWDIEPIFVGGDDPWNQQREQWHSGANFFAIDDCKIMGYRRNVNTIDALDRAGFAVLNAEDIVAGKVDMESYGNFIATMPGSELPRGGGGGRCMTMPISRD